MLKSSSPQLFGALDDALALALEPLIQSTNVVNAQVVQLLNFQNTYKKRRVSTRFTWSECMTRMIQYLEKPSIESFQNIHMDRGYAIAIIDEFLDTVDGYEEIYWKSFTNQRKYFTEWGLRLSQYHQAVGLRDRDMIQLVSHVHYGRNCISALKDRVLADYSLYICKCAHRDRKSLNVPIDIDDLIQNYYLAMNKAIDHFDISKGAFKSYLDIWLKKFLHNGHHFYGSAYAVPSGVEANHLYLPIDDIDESQHGAAESPFDIVNGVEQQKLVLTLARLVDNEGYAIKSLGLGAEDGNDS